MSNEWVNNFSNGKGKSKISLRESKMLFSNSLILLVRDM